MQVIIFQINDTVSVLEPSASCGLSITEIGRKDVPEGTPFWVVERSDLPYETPLDAWEFDTSLTGEPDGFGGTYSKEIKHND